MNENNAAHTCVYLLLKKSKQILPEQKTTFLDLLCGEFILIRQWWIKQGMGHCFVFVFRQGLLRKPATTEGSFLSWCGVWSCITVGNICCSRYILTIILWLLVFVCGSLFFIFPSYKLALFVGWNKKTVKCFKRDRYVGGGGKPGFLTEKWLQLYC